MTLLALIDSSMSRTELSRATASGMNELGNSTVSRSGSSGSSGGMAGGPSPAETSSRIRGIVLVAHGATFLADRSRPGKWPVEGAGPDTGGACYVGVSS